MRLRWACVVLGLVSSVCLAACGDDETATSTSDGGSTDSSVPAGPVCANDAECDDGAFCNGEETCSDGHCAEGTPLECDDGIACTIDQCSERTQKCASLPPDIDGDGHYSMTCDGADGKSLGDDCDDSDPLRFPGNIEFCDPENHDEDCDPKSFGEKDSDDDTFFDASCCNGSACGNDCDDQKPSVHPGATEACDLYDNDCDSKSDEGVAIKQYPDEDRDAHGKKGSKSVMMCAGSVGFAPEDNDCNDKDPEVFVGQFEICDNKDNDCDGAKDEVHDDAPWFVDADKDGFGDATSTPVYSCQRIPGRVLSHNDCNDAKAAISPAQPEICDGIDNDCSSKKDFKIGTNDFEDDDDDGLADIQCVGGPDCNDKDPSAGKDFDEICDRIDNDCDKVVDEETAMTVWFLDMDGDGWGIKRGTALTRCEPIPGRAANLGDCDDETNASHPNAKESCNGTDDDCDGAMDEGTDSECSLDDAVAICKAGACSVLSCLPGHDDCNGNAADGCECAADIDPLDDQPSGGCVFDADCQDADYCNGHERCDTGMCYAGTPVNCTVSATVLQGNVFIRNSIDVAGLKGIKTITGTLTVAAKGLSNLTGLESLNTIGGDLIVDGNLEQNNLPMENTSLVALVGSGLSNLVTVGGKIHIANNSALTFVSFPSLVTARGMEISNNAALTRIDGFKQLVALDGSLSISSNPELLTLELPELLSVTQSVSIAGNIKLNDPNVPKLAEIGSQTGEPVFEILFNPKLQTLARFGATVLANAGSPASASIENNVSLCVATELAARLTGFASVVVGDNRIIGCADTGILYGSHVRSFDGVAYSFSPIGELTLVQSTTDNLEIQVRTSQAGNSLTTAYTRAVAARVGSDRVALYLGDTALRVNGARFDPQQGTWTDLPGAAGRMNRVGNVYTVAWADGSTALFIMHSSFIEVQVEIAFARSGKIKGLLGNRDDKTASDLVARGGSKLEANPSFSTFYALFVDSYRITQANSLFDYGQLEDTATFTNRDFPSTLATLAMLDPVQRSASETACMNAEVEDSYWFDACVLDVSISGETLLAAGFAPLTPPVVELNQNKMPTMSMVGTVPPFTADPDDNVFLGVVQTIPTTSATNVDVSTPIVIYFNDELNPSTLSDSNLTVTAAGTPVFGVFSADLSEMGNTIVYFQPFDPLPASATINVSMKVAGLLDDGANGLQNVYSFSFTTRTGVTPPPADLSYEAGPTGWAFSGDASIINSPNGDVIAPNGTHMVVICTDALFGGTPNASTSSSVTSGPISVPGGTTQVLFDYDFASNEFDTYVGEQYDDSFSMTISGPNGAMSVTVASVNGVGATASVPATITSMPNAQHTGWKTHTTSLGALGSPITLSFHVTDVGDSSYASAAFIDHIRFQ